MRFAREIRRAASEMPAGVGDLFHFTSSKARHFTIFDRKLFHVLHSETFHFPIIPTAPTVPSGTASKNRRKSICGFRFFVGNQTGPLEHDSIKDLAFYIQFLIKAPLRK